MRIIQRQEHNTGNERLDGDTDKQRQSDKGQPYMFAASTTVITASEEAIK